MKLVPRRTFSSNSVVYTLYVFFILYLLNAFWPPSAFAYKPEASNPLVIGIYDGLRLCAQKDDSGYSGFTIDIWDKIAKNNSLPYVFKALPSMEDLVVASELNDIDLAVSCHVISPERASRVDFSVPIAYSSIAIVSKRREVPSLRFAARVLSNERVVRSFLLLLFVTFIAALVLKRQAIDDSSLGRIWSILILGSGVHSFLSNKKRTHLPVLAVTSLRLVLVSILVGTSASVVFDEELPRDATQINGTQFAALISEGLGVLSSTPQERWSQKKISDLNLSGDHLGLKQFAREESMIESLRSGDINHVVAYESSLPYYLHLISDDQGYYISYKINASAPVAFIYGADLSQQLRRMINSELAALNHDGTIANIEKYWANTLD